MKLMLKKSEKKPEANEHAEEPVDAPEGYAPHIVQRPMHKNAEKNHGIERRKEALKPKAKPSVKKSTELEIGPTTVTPSPKPAQPKSLEIGPATVTPSKPTPTLSIGPTTVTPSPKPPQPKEPSMVATKSIPNVQLLFKSEGARGGHVIGHTKSGKPIYGVKRVHAALDKKAAEAAAKHGLFSEEAHPAIAQSQRALDQHYSESTPGYEFHWSPKDHREAAEALQAHKSTLTDQHEGYATQGMINRHHASAEKKETAAKHSAIDRHEGHAEGTTAKRAEAGIQKRRAYSEKDPPRHTKKSLVDDFAEVHVDTIEKSGKGAGSRGGKVVRHTKSGKPVYESAAKKSAESASTMMHNWHNNADKSGNPEHHAIAAKQALHSAYYHHHAGNEIDAHDAMTYADHHRAQYEKQGHKSRTTAAVEKLHGSTSHEIGHAGYSPEEHGLPSAHPEAHAERDAQKHAKSKTESGLSNLETARNASVSANHATAQASRDNSPSSHADAKEAHEHAANMHTAARNIGATIHHGKMARMHGEKTGMDSKIKKAITPGSNSIGGHMSNEVADLFKSELGATTNASANNKPFTKCIHCAEDLSKSDIVKGLTTHFVADDNDNPHDGDEHGHVEPSRGVPGAKENDEIAPLLKGMKGPEAGDNEEYPIQKSEMDEMGMNTKGLENGWYTITKGEMKKLDCTNHIEFLSDRKNKVAKSLKPAVKQPETPKNETAADFIKKSVPARAGGVHGPGGNPLVQWAEGDDKQIAEYIEKSGTGYGLGTDESIKTEGRGY